MWRYVEDQLNVTSPNISLIKKLVTNVWKIFAAWKAGLIKMLFWTFFSAWPYCPTHQISYLSDPVLVFLQITPQIFDKIYETKYSFWNLEYFTPSRGKIIVFRKNWARNDFLLLRISKMFFDMGSGVVHWLSAVICTDDGENMQEQAFTSCVV